MSQQSTLDELIALGEYCLKLENHLSLMTHYIGGDSGETNDWGIADERWRRMLSEKMKKLAEVEAENARLRGEGK